MHHFCFYELFFTKYFTKYSNSVFITLFVKYFSAIFKNITHVLYKKNVPAKQDKMFMWENNVPSQQDTEFKKMGSLLGGIIDFHINVF